MCPWTIGPAFLGAVADYDLEIVSDTFPGSSELPPEEERDAIFFPTELVPANYNLWLALGSPTDPVDVAVSISGGSNLGSLLIPSDFHPDSTFSITLTGNGRAVGCGGRGGFGGRTELGPTITYDGQDGSAPSGNTGNGITSYYDFTLNADDGYVFGGGGGGGGGSYGSADESHTGGGGGGGQGWNKAWGGTTHLGSNTAYTGEQGSLSAPGAGAQEFGSGGDGGAGGEWGTAGDAGTGTGPGSGGTFGLCIEGLQAITVTLGGAKNQATLESENRLIGGYTNVTFA